MFRDEAGLALFSRTLSREKMQLPSVALLQAFVVVSWAQSSFFIRDYFIYKNISSVVGFSCGDTEEDVLTMRLLNAAGIYSAIKPVGFQIDLLKYFLTDRMIGVFVDMRCSDQNARAIFDESTAYGMFNYTYTWLILGSNMSHAVSNLNDTVFTVITDFVIRLSSNSSDYVLYDVYNQCKRRGGVLNITTLGTWRIDDGFTITLTTPKLIRRRNFNRMVVKASGIVLHRPPSKPLVEYLESDSRVVMDTWPKFGYNILTHISEIYNFTLEVLEINHWEKNDSCGPVMGSLKKAETDLSYYPSILTTERYGYARVILQQWPARTCFMFRTIPASKMKPWVILKPFTLDVWCTVLALVVLIIIILSFILKLEHADEYSCSITALTAIGALCQQGFPSLSNQSASRIAMIQITVFGLLLFNYYSAAIVSARLNEPLHKMNDSLYSLVHSKMTLAAEQNVFFNFLLRNTRPDVQYFKHHWNTIPESKRFLSIEDGVQEIRKGGFAYHADPGDIYPLIEVEFDKQMICQLTEVHLLQPSEVGLWCNSDGHFHEITKLGLIRMSTSGIRRREISRQAARRPYCPSEEVFVSSVTIYEAAPILILLLFGMLISLIVFSIEIIVFRMTHSKQAADALLYKRHKLLPKNKAPPKNNRLIPILPKASDMFENALITKRKIADKHKM